MTEQRDHAGHVHGHGHGHAGRSGSPVSMRMWKRLRHAVTAHSHDSGGRLDTALETSRRGVRTLVWSFAALSATAIAQSVIVAFTGSVALLATRSTMSPTR